MNDPSPYYVDNSYLEISTPVYGDIICYFDDNGTPNNLPMIQIGTLEL